MPRRSSPLFEVNERKKHGQICGVDNDVHESSDWMPMLFCFTVVIAFARVSSVEIK